MTDLPTNRELSEKLNHAFKQHVAGMYFGPSEKNGDPEECWRWKDNEIQTGHLDFCDFNVLQQFIQTLPEYAPGEKYFLELLSPINEDQGWVVRLMVDHHDGAFEIAHYAREWIVFMIMRAILETRGIRI